MQNKLEFIINDLKVRTVMKTAMILIQAVIHTSSPNPTPLIIICIAISVTNSYFMLALNAKASTGNGFLARF